MNIKKELIIYAAKCCVGGVCAYTAFPLVMKRLGYTPSPRKEGRRTHDIPVEQVLPDTDFKDAK